MTLPRKRRAPVPGDPENESDPTLRLPRPPPMTETASPAQMRRTFRPPSQRTACPPTVLKEVVQSIEESALIARKRARTTASTCDKILKALAEQALTVMADKGMTPEDEERTSPPLSPRTFYRRVGLDFESPTPPQITKTKPRQLSSKEESPSLFVPDVHIEMIPSRTPLGSLPLSLNNEAGETTDKISATSTNKTPKRGVGSKALSGDSNPSITPARVQAARCLLSFSK